jgi:hypothetical protein
MYMSLIGPVGLEAPPSISSQVARTFVASSAHAMDVDRTAPAGRPALQLINLLDKCAVIVSIQPRSSGEMISRSRIAIDRY